MAEFQKVVADAKRMCKAHQHCGECPVNNKCVIGYNINNWELFPHFDAFVEQWAEEHPVKTNRMVLEETFPELKIPGSDIPYTFRVDEEWGNAEYKGGVNNG